MDVLRRLFEGDPRATTRQVLNSYEQGKWCITQSAASITARGPLPPPCLAIYRPGSPIMHSRGQKTATDQQLCSQLIG
jgi:hypothetical protein